MRSPAANDVTIHLWARRRDRRGIILATIGLSLLTSSCLDGCAAGDQRGCSRQTEEIAAPYLMAAETDSR